MVRGMRQGPDIDLDVNHEINVTPFIDVMLVLRIIFMVAAPLATLDIHVDLLASTAQPIARPDKPLYLTLKRDRTLSLGETPVTEEGLQLAIDAVSKRDKETRVFVRADETVEYESLMAVMNRLRDGGYLHIALVALETVPQPLSTQESSASDNQGASATDQMTSPRITRQ
ncbi:TonB system transport protein ExbD [Bradyrhizobium sp. ARR65]|uniref:TonB system transport protein ExbD n=1 Tax=Bradyrhizobium sp. ARR65 TaxID=1040989 RepID=UPI0004640617|nr:TonB system transport protein ExbD [Bradyrhizobium sp. ARR65]